MPELHLFIVGSSPGAPCPSVAADALACWPIADQPRIESISLADLIAQPQNLDRCGAAWIIHSNGPATGRRAAIALLQDRQIPAMISFPGETSAIGACLEPGMTAAPPEAPPIALCALLRGLWNQASAVCEYQAELGQLREHQGGLCSQLDRLDEDLRLAARLQRDFLPQRLPQVPGLRFEVLFRPAGYVSGDIYDVFQLDDHHVGIFLADAVGHGSPAALLTVYIKHALRTRGADPRNPHTLRIVPPAEALTGLNSAMFEDLGGNLRTATAWYGVLDCRTHTLEHARAGHPYPAVLSADGHATLLETEGAMLGVFADERYQAATYQLQPGDRLLVHSDGLEWTRRAAVDGAKPGPHAYALEDLAGGTLEEALRRLTAKLDRQTGSLNQADDMTVLCVEVCPAAEAAQISAGLHGAMAQR